jgi:hypothetical protein
MKIKAFLAVSVAVMMFAVCSCAFAQYAPEIIKVTGEPKIMKKGSDKWVGCKLNMAVNNGDKIKTVKGDSLEIGFAEHGKNLVKIGSSSDVVVISAQDPYRVDLINGEAMALLTNLPENSIFEVRTPTGVSGARGTGWRSLTDGKKSAFEAYDNTIYVKGVNADGSVMEEETLVDMGYKTVVERLEKPGLVEKLTDRDMERWNTWRDEVKNREAKSAEVGDQGGGISGGSTSAGRDRLDRISREETNDVESLEDRKQDISESRDVERIQERQAEQEPTAATERPDTSRGEYKTSGT